MPFLSHGISGNWLQQLQEPNTGLLGEETEAQRGKAISQGHTASPLLPSVFSRDENAKPKGARVIWKQCQHEAPEREGTSSLRPHGVSSRPSLLTPCALRPQQILEFPLTPAPGQDPARGLISPAQPLEKSSDSKQLSKSSWLRHHRAPEPCSLLANVSLREAPGSCFLSPPFLPATPTGWL